MIRSPVPLDVDQIDHRDLVPLSDALTPPPPPTTWLVGAVALLLILVIVSFVGFTSPSRSSQGVAGRVVVQGRDLAKTGTIPIDLSKPIAVRVEQPPAGATDVEIATSVLGLSTGTSSQESLRTLPNGKGASVSASSLKLATSGKLSAELRLLRADGSTALSRQFTIAPTQPPYLSLTGFVALALTLFVGVYFTSVTSPLRLGRRQRSAYPALGLIGLFGGLAVLVWGWTLGGPEPTWVTVIVALLVGASAGVVWGRYLFQHGRRRRLRRALAG